MQSASGQRKSRQKGKEKIGQKRNGEKKGGLNREREGMGSLGTSKSPRKEKKAGQ